MKIQSLFFLIALCFSVSFAQLAQPYQLAQFDEEFGAEPAEEDTASEAPASSEGAFGDDEWSGFDYEHAGISQSEFQRVKESGMTKDKLMYLLEIGIRPSVYLQQPWNDLGVSEEEWLSERESGMEDGDIDRTYKNQYGLQSYAYFSFLVPSLYQWKTDDIAAAIAMDIAEVAAIATTIFVLEGSNRVMYGVPLIAAVHLWSGITAMVATQWDSNPDAETFSWNILPTGKNSFAAHASYRF